MSVHFTLRCCYYIISLLHKSMVNCLQFGYEAMVNWLHKPSYPKHLVIQHQVLSEIYVNPEWTHLNVNNCNYNQMFYVYIFDIYIWYIFDVCSIVSILIYIWLMIVIFVRILIHHKKIRFNLIFYVYIIYLMTSGFHFLFDAYISMYLLFI